MLAFFKLSSRAAAVVLTLAPLALGQRHVSFQTTDGGLIFGDLYGTGERGVVLAHGGQFNKESWKPQARTLQSAGFRILAIDFRGYGQSRGPGSSDALSAPLYLDVLGAVRYLWGTGSKTVSIVGASMGGWAGADAIIAAQPGEIGRLVLLGAGAGNGPPENIKGQKLVIIARDDTSGSGRRLPEIERQYKKMPEPKRMILLDGSAHAQFLFQTEQGTRVMNEIVHFLSAP